MSENAGAITARYGDSGVLLICGLTWAEVQDEQIKDLVGRLRKLEGAPFSRDVQSIVDDCCEQMSLRAAHLRRLAARSEWLSFIENARSGQNDN